MERLRVIIATESYVVNQGFHLIFNKLRQCQVVDKVRSMEELNILLEKETVDIILLSLNLLQENSLNLLLKKFKSQRPYLIAYSTDEEAEFDNSNLFAERLFVNDSKEMVLTKLGSLMDNLLGMHLENDSSDLSKREQDILRQVALGLTNNEIADKLFISTHTVITHRKKITKKLGIKSVSALTVYAIINGLIEMEDVGGEV